jgi:hypothetical protein
VPRNLLDAARLDRCGELSVFSRIAPPIQVGLTELVSRVPVFKRSLVSGSTAGRTKA